jgi:hypothetical protein
LAPTLSSSSPKNEAQRAVQLSDGMQRRTTTARENVDSLLLANFQKREIARISGEHSRMCRKKQLTAATIRER